MEPEMRGILEKSLDSLLKPEYLEKARKNYEVFKPLVKSIEDAMFGDIYATMSERFIHYTSMHERKMPSETDTEEFVDLMNRRAQEIRSKILLATSK